MLTERQQRFVNLYGGPGTGLATARAAGYEGSDATLMVTASQLLRVPAVAAALEARGVAAEPPRPDAEEAEAARKALDARARRFVDAYVASGAVLKAARRAKIPEMAAKRLLARADVRAVIEHARAEQAIEGIANAREQQLVLTKLIRGPKTDPNVRVKAVLALHTIQRGLAPATHRSGEAGGKGPTTNVMVVLNQRGPEDAGHG